MVVKKSNPTDKAILVHKGGLGDFLQTWPALHALRCAWPESQLLWAGNESRRIWLDPLLIQPCPPGIRRLVESLYFADRVPEELSHSEIIWFGLDRSGLSVEDRRIHYLRGIDPDREIPPRIVYRQALAAMGIGRSPWRGDFQRWFRNHEDSPSGERLVLLFPGSGHPMKCWPQVQFILLARWLQGLGFSPLFVIGPAEAERGVLVEDFPTAVTEELVDLQQMISKACFVIGNDSGPMHLAGMLGTPGIALFGPTSPLRWGPVGFPVITGTGGCLDRPCSATARINCTDNRCMRSITQERVRDLTALLLVEKETGLLRTVRSKPVSAKIGR
jgi:ADP-heptose:LPS heptosyltransferase